MNNPIIDKRKQQIQDSRTREYFDEVLSCYYSGNYRSTVVMLYATVICDIIYKLDELVNVYGDVRAQQILDDVRALQTQNPTSAEWEKQLVEKCKDANRVLEIPDYSNVISLQSLRHLCAHPVINGNQELYRPNADIVLGHIYNMLDGILTKSAYYKKDVFNIFLTDIANAKSLLTVSKDLENYITAKYLDKLNSVDDEYHFFKSLWKLVFELADQDCRENRGVNFTSLRLMVKRHKDIFLERFENEKAYFGRHIHIGDCRRFRMLVKYFDVYPEFFDKLSEDVKLTINNGIDLNTDLMALGIFRATNVIEHIFGARPEKEGSAGFLSLYLRENISPALALDYNIQHYSRSYSYDAGDSRFTEFIEPYVYQFTLAQLEQIVKCVNENSQLYDRRRARRDNSIIYERIVELNPDFDFKAYPYFRHG